MVKPDMLRLLQDWLPRQQLQHPAELFQGMMMTGSVMTGDV